jgi:IS1 family transposase
VRKTFAPLWAVVAQWQRYFSVTDGWSVYPGFISYGDQIVSKLSMTRVEGENNPISAVSGKIASQDTALFKI